MNFLMMAAHDTITSSATSMVMLLAKNPAGWLEAFDVTDPALPVILSVNAQVPDGRDTSWLWDVDYGVLKGRPVVVTGERRLDLALRLHVAGVPFQLCDSFGEAVSAVPAAGAPSVAPLDSTMR